MPSGTSCCESWSIGASQAPSRVPVLLGGVPLPRGSYEGSTQTGVSQSPGSPYVTRTFLGFFDLGGGGNSQSILSVVSLSVLEAHRLQQEGCDRHLRLCFPGLHPITCELCCQALGQALQGGKWGGKSSVTRSGEIKTCSGRFYQRHHALPVLFLDVPIFQVSPASFHLCSPHSSPGDRGWHCNVWGDGKATFNCVDSVGRSFREGAGCTET